MSTKAKPSFFIAVAAVVAALIGFAVWQFGSTDEETKAEQATPQLSKEDMDALKAPTEAQTPGEHITTAKEYEFVAGQKLPEVKGVAAYAPLEGDIPTVQFSINVWAGWAPIVHANEGFAANKVWTAPDGKKFKVKLVLIDDPISMRNAFAGGKIHIGWATVDMLPLFLEELSKDSRAMPRVYQQIDWSNGGDGIVARDNIKTVADLRGKTVVLAQNSPSQFFLLNTLINAGVQPAEVQYKYTADAFQAAAAYHADKSIAAVVSWAPDIYNLSDVPGNKLLLSTGTANKLIADVWFARADFAKDHHNIIEGLVRGIFDSMESIKDDNEKNKLVQWMAEGYNMPASEVSGMLADAHSTNYAENRDFFLNANNGANFERTYNMAFFLYKKLRVVTNKTPFEQIVDFSVLESLKDDPKYAAQKNEYQVRFAPSSVEAIQAETEEILTKTVRIHFEPTRWSFYHYDRSKGAFTEELADPNSMFTVEEVGKMSAQYGAARIVIEGHADASMKGKGGNEQAIKRLSQNRADAVKEELIKMFPNFSPDQFSTIGKGWDVPADPKKPYDHANNRRVEIKVYPAEAG